MCMFCEQRFQKLSRHRNRRHNGEPKVVEALALNRRSEEQILAFERIRLMGDHHHNCYVLALGEGELTVVRNPSKQNSHANFLPWPHCLGFFKGDELWWHCLICPHKATIDKKKKWKKVQVEAKLLLLTSSFSIATINQELYQSVIQFCP